LAITRSTDRSYDRLRFRGDDSLDGSLVGSFAVPPMIPMIVSMMIPMIVSMMIPMIVSMTSARRRVVV